jgi:hypothetical protein
MAYECGTTGMTSALESLQALKSSNENALTLTGLSLDFVLDAHEEQQRERKLVCICGHPLKRHGSYAPGRPFCKSGQMWCPCVEPFPVLEVEDTRYFTWVTRGYGAKHALIAGLARLIQGKKVAAWTVPLICANCGRTDGPIFPAPINSLMRISDKPEKLNLFSCQVCVNDSLGLPR